MKKTAEQMNQELKDEIANYQNPEFTDTILTINDETEQLLQDNPQPGNDFNRSENQEE